MALDARNGIVALQQTIAPAAPAAGKRLLYPKSDGWYQLDSAGVESRVGPVVDVVRDFSRTGTLTVAVGTSRVGIPFPCVIESVVAHINTAPTGAAVTIDVNKNGVTIYATQANRPTIAAAAFVATAGAHSTTALAAGDYLTVDVDTIGSTVAGANLVVSVVLRRT